MDSQLLLKKAFASFIICISMLILAGNANSNSLPIIQQDQPLIGRWDMTIEKNGKQLPGWLEVKLSGNHTLVGSVVIIVGSARPVSKINVHGDQFDFSVPPQWENGNGDFLFNGSIHEEKLSGTMVTSEGETLHWTAVRAPRLNSVSEPKWGQPVELFNGKDLTGWKPTKATNQWVVQNGILTSPHSGANIITEQTFTDFKLHVEFRYGKGSNSGVYLRGRYEVQIEDNPKDAHPSSTLFSGVYGFLSPSEINTNGPNEWNTYDITLVGRMVTIVVNGKTVISNQEIPGITGGALDSKEASAGPIYLQGDHGPIEFRKITITPAQ